ncbi:MAG: transcription-repair coupling factor [Clostridia bacterium]|nr:transcription-repair coupling factor [Clostridia bacterium]
MLKDILNAFNEDDEVSSAIKSIRSGLPSAVFGVGFSEKCHIASLIGTPILYIVKDGIYAAQVVEELSALVGEEVVYLPAKDDVLLYKTSFDKGVLYKRLNALYAISKGARYVVATPESLLQLFPSDLVAVEIKKGGTYDVYELAEKLVSIGYRREEFASLPATFALRGDIFEIFPINDDKIYRVDFFGDEVETIKRYDPDSKEDKEFVGEVTAISATDVLVSEEDKKVVAAKLDEAVLKFRTLAVKDDARIIARELKEKIYESPTDDSLQFIMPLLSGVTDDFTGFMPEDTTVVFDECKLVSENLSAILKEHTERFLNLSSAGKAMDFTVRQYADSRKVLSRLTSGRVVALQSLAAAVPFFNPLKTFSVKCSAVARYAVDPESAFKDIANWKFGGYKIFVACGNEKRQEDFYANLLDHNVFAVKGGDKLQSGVAVVSNLFIPKGFIYHQSKIVVIGTGDLFIALKKDKKIKKRRGDMFKAPEVGDFAVHEVHGIGYVKGVTRITTQEGSKDYVAVEYLGGDILYVGVDDMDKLTKYVGGGEKPVLNKIGGKEFERIKQRARESIARMTIDLKKLYKARSEKIGFVFSPEGEAEKEFDDAFEFEPTEDQVQSEVEIKGDMESGKVMDRLLCGDVGFGKTEVAFRAVFKAVLDGKQAALVCPTTILCEQHYRAAEKRFADFGVNVASLNRFKNEKEQKEVVDGLKEGRIDFVIGTHRLFGKDVGFKALGLLVLDEEQRFGVEHKEKLKLLKDNVDTLTMTATPIPRTLHMSLSGIRDISVINTPPKTRIPVQTYVAEESDGLFRDAIRRELARGGQVLIMYNRVETIYKFAEEIKALVPEAKVVVAHGQMDKRALENSVIGFYEEKYDVLIATTIIENGIDIPKANTLIVTDSDRLGLSTLYQLKGRVGRSNVLAHAYFTFKRDKVLSDSAYKRLSALMEFTDMGSGYKIALRDLEIRGAGNILGREQHGHMDKIGYELYSKLLKESLGEGLKEYDTKLDVKMDAYIPDDYIVSSPSRMDCYKQIAEIRNAEDKKRVLGSIEENYGKAPEEVLNLILIAELKVAARECGALEINLSKKSASVVLNGMDALKKEGMLPRISAYKGEVTLSFKENPTLSFLTEGRETRETAEKMREFFSF